MLYTIANSNWAPGQALTPSSRRIGLFRTRAEAIRATDGQPILALTLSYNHMRGIVLVQGKPARYLSSGWSAPAIVDDAGVIMVFASIPADLVRVIGPIELRFDRGHHERLSPPHLRIGSPKPATSAMPLPHAGQLLALKAMRYLQMSAAGSSGRSRSGGWSLGFGKSPS